LNSNRRAACVAAVTWIALGLPRGRAEAQPAAADASRRSAASITDMRVHDPALMEARSALLSRAESELARGETAAATDTFDRAAMMLHAPDTEMGLVRAYMQAGQYRRALAFCAHAAGAHLESAPAGALYAWLLRAAGQVAFADRVLGETLARSPRDPVCLEVRRAFSTPWPVAAGPLLHAPHRMAPQAVMEAGQASIPAAARVVSSGVLVRDGTLALVPSSAARSTAAGMLWVRNGLGQGTRARIDGTMQALEASGVTVLRLDAALDPAGREVAAPRDPFAGSPGFALEYAASGDAVAAWPWLSQGFFGSFQGDTGLRRLGIEIADGPHGGPVLDAHGRLAGIALQGPDREALMLPASRWQHVPGISPAISSSQAASPATPARPSGAVAADEGYESALRLALQVIA
jgi:tetratricopeptide (TPR) repeat protein